MTAQGASRAPSAVPPRTSSLAAPVSQSASPHSPTHFRSTDPDVPERIGETTRGLPDDTTAQHRTDLEEVPPSYEQLRLTEPGNPRFGRWRSWVEKRGAERRLERAEQVTNGHKTESSWDLPDAASNEDSTTSYDGPPSFEFSRSQSQEEAIAAARRRDALLENRLSASQYSVSNPDYLDPSAADSRTTRRSRSASANSSGQGATRLTHNVVIERLGARFERGLPEKPLCGLILPTQAPSTPKAEAVGEKDRFLLVGTAAGLYLVDLDPTLSPIGPLRNRASSSPSSSRAPRPPLETNILPLWLNAGVHHIESYLEPARANSEGAKGLIVMLVSNEVVGGVEIKMWTLSALINLVKWRVFNESSHPIDLLPVRAKSSSSHSRTPSLNTFKHTILNSPSPKGKGKQLAPDDAAHASTSWHARCDSTSSTTTQPPSDRSSLAHEWVDSCVKLPLPKPHTPPLFFKLSRTPPRSAERARSRNESGRVTDDDSEEDDDDNEDVTNEQLRARRKRIEEEGKLFLLVATKGVVYVFESSLEQRRSWKLSRELTAPATPRFMQLVRSPKPRGDDTLHATLEAPRSAPSPHEDISYPSDLCLLLGMSHRSVLIRLDDCSVVELLAPSATTRSTPTGARSRSKSLTNSIKSTASSTASHHRSTPSLKLNLLEHPIVKKVQQVIEGGRRSGQVPAGFTGREDIPLGRRLNEDGGSTDDLSRSKSASENVDSRWIASEELTVRVGKGKESVKRFHLVTRGQSTFVYPSPLTSARSPATFDDVDLSTHSTAATLVLALVPIHTFEWPRDLTISHVTHSIETRFESVKSRPGGGGGTSQLALYAFTRTGLSVQEGFVSHESIDSTSDSPSSHSRQPFFVPTRRRERGQHATPEERDEEEEEEAEDLGASAHLDFATDSALLCASLESGTSLEHGHTYFYTRSHTDYVVKRLTVDLS